MQKGDIVLVPFPFTDLSSTKKRPAMVLVTTNEDVTLAFITSQTKWKEEWNIDLIPTAGNGLKKRSVLRLAKITTLDKELILGRLGSLSSEMLDKVNENLMRLFALK
jgi:mRNA interferase MazF